MPNKSRASLRESGTSMYSQKRGRRFSPLMLIGISVPIVLLLLGGTAFAWVHLASHAAGTATPNANCSLLVPANPLSAQGLATPYQLSATDAANGPCNETNAGQSAFVQGVIYDPATGAMSVYNPLVVDAGTQPAIVPTAPTLPANAVVGLWFGFNGTDLTLHGARGNSLNQGKCVNGQNQSVFGQFAYCNAVAFYAAANKGIAAGLVKVPALGTANDGLPCSTTRDFGIIDQDQSDNVQTKYLSNANGQIAQFSAANQTQLANANVIANPSDNALLTTFIDPTLGCTPWTAANLADNNTQVSALALDEIMANADQTAPVALIPLTDPMTLNGNNQSLTKTNLYRAGVDMPPAANTNAASGTTYCQNFLTTGLARLTLDMPTTLNATTPDAGAANSLFTFLAMRYNQSYVNLNCQALINQPNPVAVQTDANGIVTSATITTPGTGTTGGGAGGAGGVQQVATGSATVRLNRNAGNAQLTSKVTYANHPNQRIKLNLVPNSCTGTPTFSRTVNTNGQGNNNTSLTVNGLRGVNAIPNNWFFTVTDPTQANNPVVGCGAVVPNGTTSTATLGTVPTTCPTNPTTPVTAPTTTVPADPTTVATNPTTVATDPTTVATDPTTVATDPATANPTTVVVAPTTPACSNTGTGAGTVTTSPPANPSMGQNNPKNRPYGGHKGKGW